MGLSKAQSLCLAARQGLAGLEASEGRLLPAWSALYLADLRRPDSLSVPGAALWDGILLVKELSQGEVHPLLPGWRKLLGAFPLSV